MTRRNGLRIAVGQIETFEESVTGVLRVREELIQTESGVKLWCIVTTPPTGAAIAFQDLFDINRSIVRCEIDKYERERADATDPVQWSRWGAMPRDFTTDTFEYGATYPALRDRYGLPR